MKLKKVKIHKYKSFINEQEFNLEYDINVLVGMNESGKTSVLEAIAKTNYFQDDVSFKFDTTHDYPRKEKKQMDKSRKNPQAVTCTYEIDEDTIRKIEKEVGKCVFKEKEFSVTRKYDNTNTIGGVIVDKDKFIENKIEELAISDETIKKKIKEIKNSDDLKNLKNEYKDEKYIEALDSLNKYFENKDDWHNPIAEYIHRKFLSPNRPKFLYYDEYFSLPSRISIEQMQNQNLEKYELKTAKALFELADINTEKLIKADNFENFKAELEATGLNISNEIFKYWKTNKNLELIFDIDKIEKTDSKNDRKIVEHILDIRIKNKGVSLPLKNRSKGFNWFFSFLVWFKKIQEDENSNYILLLDEPGLNLHASAQADLLRFLEDLKETYQIVYTTHSPFMISSNKLNRVRTVLETDSGSLISDSIQEKDPNTLFPLQAALGYDIAQNLFISNKNLLVEGVADLIILTTLSGVLEKENRTSLSNDITIVPTGGLDKVATFISLLRGAELNIVCLLDSYNDIRGEAKISNMIKEKIIKKNKVKFFHEYLEGYDKADLEDLFVKSDYLKLFNLAFSGKYDEIKETNLNSDIKQIIIQINKRINEDRFNHYLPAKEIINKDKDFFNSQTLDNFEKVFKDINKLFS